MTVPASASIKDSATAFSGVVRVEGIKNSSSALAYIEQFYEEYDWEAFAYAQTLSIAEIDKLAASLKVSSADDKNTWFVSFKAMSVPYLEIQEEEGKLPAFAIAMICMAIAFLISFIGVAAGEAAIAVIGILGGIISMVIGVIMKMNNKGAWRK